jgi:ketosteroid isomerase-like protein
MTKEEAWKFANHWVEAWNSHDLEVILTHYDDAVELVSPVAVRILGAAEGKVTGKANLQAYFRLALELYPELHFTLKEVFWGVNSVVLYYTNQVGTSTAEFMELLGTGKVARVVANYNA